MKRSLFVVVAVALSVACTDNPNPIEPGERNDPVVTEPSLATVMGRISVLGSGGDRVVQITTANGDDHLLLGSESAKLTSVDGADVIVRGTWDGNPGLVVHDFQVVSMFDRPAVDGTLELTALGYSLRLANGQVQQVTGCPDSIAEHVGKRLWVVGSEDEPPFWYGVIAEV